MTRAIKKSPAQKIRQKAEVEQLWEKGAKTYKQRTVKSSRQEKPPEI